jgi:hypothetical protein
MGVLTSGLLVVLVLVEFGVIVFLFLRNRSLSHEVVDLHVEQARLAALAVERGEQIQTMRRIYQETQIKPIRPPMRRAQRSD